MSFPAGVPTIIPPRPQVVFDLWHPQLINIQSLDPNGPIKVVVQLAKASQADPQGPIALSDEQPITHIVPDLRPYMAENPSLAILVSQIQEAIRVIAQGNGWIPSPSTPLPTGAIAPLPSGEVVEGEPPGLTPVEIIQPIIP